jgi:hypothetical protein
MNGIGTKTVLNKDRGFVSLLTHPCGFKISEQRYKEICSGMTIQDLEKQIEVVE